MLGESAELCAQMARIWIDKLPDITPTVVPFIPVVSSLKFLDGINDPYLITQVENILSGNIPDHSVTAE